jgi:hypothetical protein
MHGIVGSDAVVNADLRQTDHKARRTPRIHSEKPIFDPRAVRLAELSRFLRHRYSGHVTDDQQGRAALYVLLNHLAFLPVDQDRRLRIAVRDWAPWMPADEVDSLLASIACKPRRFKAATLGKIIGLTYADRKALRITTIAATDMPDTKVLERERSKRRRAGKGAKAREASDARAKPWESLGISRRSFYRHKAAETVPATGGTNSTGPYTSLRGAVVSVPAVEAANAKPQPTGKRGAKRSKASMAKRLATSPQSRPSAGGVGSGQNGAKVRITGRQADQVALWQMGGFKTVGGLH